MPLAAHSLLPHLSNHTVKEQTTPMVPRRFFWFLDLAVLAVAFGLAYLLVPNLQPLFALNGLFHTHWAVRLLTPALWDGILPPAFDMVWILATMALATLPVLMLGGLCAPLPQQSRTRIVVGSWLAALVGVSLIALVLFALKNPDWSRLFIFSFSVLAALGFSIYRLTLRHYFMLRRNAGVYAKNLLLIGDLSAVSWLERHFTDVSTTEYRLLGYLAIVGVDSRYEGQSRDARNGALHAAEMRHPASAILTATREAPDQVKLETPHLPCFGKSTDLGDLLIHRPIHEVIAVAPSDHSGWIEQVVQDCDYLGVLLRIVPAPLLAGRRTLQTLYPFAALNLPAVVLAPPHLDSDALFVKRIMDIVASGLALILLSPIFLAVAIAIKVTTPNLPIFYRWRVVGQQGVEFTGYKFTTMVANADQLKTTLENRNEMSGPVFKIQDDPRITPLGRFLRKFSLNELPQLWSVFKGDMSLVGPRPAFRHELDRYEFWHKRKLSIRPGITCLWQIRGRNKISVFDDWVRMDLEYIDNWSLWLDCRILVRTLWVVVAGTGS